jgi:DNA mismatch endonuclease (patch repair protein)
MDRRANMRAIRSTGMKPELAVRRLVHKMGYRFRLHRHDLPGRPDMVFPAKKKVIFVHGCFWHSHNCKLAHDPKSNRDYWGPKLERNRLRDAKNLAALAAEGWESLVVWECETCDEGGLKQRVGAFLNGHATGHYEGALL